MSRYASVYFSPGRGAAQTIIGFIQKAQVSLDVAVYSITHPQIAQAVIEAHQRGVKVRVLTDRLQAAGRYSADETLEAAGVPLRRDSQKGSMHHKMAIADPKLPTRAVAMGSFNWTKSADERNAELMVIVRLKIVVDQCLNEFNALWAANAD